MKNHDIFQKLIIIYKYDLFLILLFLIISKDVQFHLKKNKIDFYVFPIFPNYYVTSIFSLKFNFIEHFVFRTIRIFF